MKVICIDTKPYADSEAICAALKEGDVYEVKQSFMWGDCWSVKGLSIDYGGDYKQHFNKRRFVPLSEIDETELIKERESQFVELT